MSEVGFKYHKLRNNIALEEFAACWFRVVLSDGDCEYMRFFGGTRMPSADEICRSRY